MGQIWSRLPDRRVSSKTLIAVKNTLMMPSLRSKKQPTAIKPQSPDTVRKIRSKRSPAKRIWRYMFIGHTLRKDKYSITKQGLTWNPHGKRMGRPNATWRRDLEVEMRIIEKTRNRVKRLCQESGER